jgi:hypothetical protein
MNRQINIVSPQVNFNLPGFTNISYSDISQIINHSNDIVYCAIINKLENTDIQLLISELATKVRLGGQLIIVLNNIKEICKDYFSNIISDNDFMNIISNSKNLFYIKDIETIYHQSLVNEFNMLNLDYSNKQVAITLQRKVL